jgi:hypothetical protein
MKKDSFIIYKAFYKPIAGLSLEHKGELLESIFKYQIDGEEPDPGSPVYIPFQFFKNQFDVDFEKYKKVCERNRRNGQNGGRPKKNEKKETQKTESVISEPKKADNDNDNDKKKDIISDPPDPKLIEFTKKIMSYFPTSVLKGVNVDKWADIIEKLKRIDGLSFEEIEEIVKFGRNNDFWSRNFLSIAKLRKKDPNDVKYFIVFKEQLSINKRYRTGSQNRGPHDTDF